MEKFDGFLKKATEKAQETTRKIVTGAAIVGSSIFAAGEASAQNVHTEKQEQNQAGQTQEIKTAEELKSVLAGYEAMEGHASVETALGQLAANEAQGFTFTITKALGQTQAGADMQAQQNLINAGMGKHLIYSFIKQVGNNIEVLKIEIHK